MELPEDLRASIEGLYEVFSVYPLAKYIDPCLHCYTLDDEAKLHSKPLRQLEIPELRDYAVDALSVWGGIDDFKHFLPRIFELYVTTSNPAIELIDAEIIFSKFRHGEWHTWPIDEQTAIREFLHALWANVLTDPPELDSYSDVGSWLCTMAQAEDDLGPYLEQWLDDQRLSASFALSSLLLCCSVIESGRNGRNAFWDGRDDQYLQLKNWARTQPVLEKLKRARAVLNGSASASEFEAAIQMLNFPDGLIEQKP